jgi:L-2,4-diaminobutyric acid acetyltransferase
MTNPNPMMGGEAALQERVSTPQIEKTAKISSLVMKDSESVLDSNGVAVRTALEDDGALLWELARDSGGIDMNSPYAYMMQCRNFTDTCVIAEVFGTPAGFVTAHRLPGRKHALFVWQVAVLPEFRGLGIAKRMLEDLVEQPSCLGVRKLETTVTPSNKASKALFSAFAKARGAELDSQPCFAASDFPKDGGHEAEHLFTVQPIHPID